MASVYKNSSLTLAATGSPNCDSGLFHKYPDPQIHTLTVPDTNGLHQKVYVRSRTPHWSDMLCSDHKDPLQQNQDYPLLHRAWAFQERLLSTRVLHFCKTELVWECMETWTCQCGSFYPSQNLKKSIAGHKQPEVDTVVAEESTSLGSWANIVEGYTKLDLTYESDRLPALAGLAEHIHHGHRGRYLAGLWEDSLAKDLVWHRLTWDPDRDYPRPSNSTLPTWSWASISDRIYYHPLIESFEQMCDIFQVECTSVDISNPRGNVADGRLVVRGHVTKARLNNDGLKLIGANATLPGWQFDLDYNIPLQGPGYVEDGELVFCLNIGKGGSQNYSLILRCISEEGQVYERIGLISLSILRGYSQEFHPDWDVFGPEQGTQELLFEREIPRHKELYLVKERRDEEKERTGTWPTDSLEPMDIDHEDDWGRGRYVVAKLTAEQAAAANKLPGVRLSKRESVPLDDPEDAKWFLSPQNAERKARGERYRRYYLGKVVTIV